VATVTHDGERTPGQREPVLAWWWRLVAGIVGVALAALGVAAAFRTTNDVAATALLVVGAYFGLIAMLGRVPRVRWGGNELDPRAAYTMGRRAGASDVARAVDRAVIQAVEPPAPTSQAVPAEARADISPEFARRLLDLTRSAAEDPRP
jgi:hypothetical protein